MLANLCMKNFDLVSKPFDHPIFGKSIMLNILHFKQKICSFNCVYCDLGTVKTKMKDIKGFSLLSTSEIIQKISEDIEGIALNCQDLRTLVVGGNGDPTLHPEFKEIVTQLFKIRKSTLKDFEISFSANGLSPGVKNISTYLEKFNQKLIKFDAGSFAMLKKINGPILRTSHGSIVDSIRSLKNVTLSGLFLEGSVDNTQEEHLEDWIESVGLVHPEQVFIHTLEADIPEKNLKRTSEDTLYIIAQKLKRRTQINSKVLYIPND